jgi:hypothetical protein
VSALRTQPAVVAPVHLGCCPPGGPPCLLCGASTPQPDPEAVAALVEATVRDRGEPVRVAFLGGDPPPDVLLDAIAGRPFTARVRPDRLDRARTEALARRGCVAVELDVGTMSERALAECRRPYAPRLVRQQLQGLPGYGLAAGVVLAPGLPGTAHATAVDDAEQLAPLATFARIHPVLVLEGSLLAERWRAGTYTPLTLGQAITTALAVRDVLCAAGVDVVRVGQQPGPDGLPAALAGPVHPAFGQLVAARERLRALRARLQGTPAGSVVVVRCHPADETPTSGPLNSHVRTLRAELGLEALRVRADSAVARGELEVETAAPLDPR